MVEPTEPAAQLAMILPRPSLRPLVHGYQGYHTRSAPGVHRGLPSRALTFIVTIEGTVDVAFGDAPVRSFSTMVGGLHGQPARIEHDGRQYGIQTALTPLGARALFGMPAGELANDVVELDALGPFAAELTERVRSARTWAERIRALEEVLVRMARPAAVPAPELGWAWRRLTRSDGAVEVAELAAEVGWSRQHLRSRFEREFGLTPKLAARVLRFEAACRLLTAKHPPALAEVAATCGYADQSHLNREWRALAGASPSAWMAEQLPFVQAGADDGRLAS